MGFSYVTFCKFASLSIENSNDYHKSLRWLKPKRKKSISGIRWIYMQAM